MVEQICSYLHTYNTCRLKDIGPCHYALSLVYSESRYNRTRTIMPINEMNSLLETTRLLQLFALLRKKTLHTVKGKKCVWLFVRWAV